MIALTFIFGLLFGGILQYAKLNKFNTISGLAMGIDFAVAKAILIAMGVGARMSGGCTSGHILSGGMQLALSSFIFAIFVFASLLITGRFFYREKTTKH